MDLFKFIASLLVVSIHEPPFRKVSRLLHVFLMQYAARLAVPFFFICAGYFLFRKTREDAFDPAAPLRYARKTLRLYGIWTLLYLPLSIPFFQKNMPAAYPLAFLHYALCYGSYIHLWYLHGLVIATLILTFLLREKTPLKGIMALAGLMVLAAVIPSAYPNLVSPLLPAPILKLCDAWLQIFISTRNGFFVGFPMMAVGMLLAYRPVRLKTSALAAGCAASLALFLGEWILVRAMKWSSDPEFYLTLPLAAGSLFLLAARIQLPPSEKTRALRGLSTLVYLVHTGLQPISHRICAALARTTSLPLDCQPMRFLVVTLASLSLSAVLLALSRRFPVLKKLYA